jgi:hypothetical protein
MKSKRLGVVVLRLCFILPLLMFCTNLSEAAQSSEVITNAAEQRELVETLSGELVAQRYSDSKDIYATAEFLKSKYEEAGIDAAIADYDPMQALPYYAETTDQTYRSYFKHLLPVLEVEFNSFCGGTLPDEKSTAVANRLKRVGLEKETFCQVESSKRVETYISATVQHTVEVSRKSLASRSLETWPNVVALVRAPNQPSDGTQNPVCVVGAHMDSVAREGGSRGPVVSPKVAAPGADDNASGTAAVLTLAKAAKNWVQLERPELNCDLLFVHFSGEEEGLLGSLAFAHLQVAKPVRWMVNFDMVAFNSKNSPNVMNIGYDAKFGRGLPEAFNAGGKLNALVIERETFIYSSDQIAFWSIGVPAISVSEQACADLSCRDPFKYFNPNLHTTEDTTTVLDFEYAANLINQSFEGLKRLLTYKLY